MWFVNEQLVTTQGFNYSKVAVMNMGLMPNDLLCSEEQKAHGNNVYITQGTAYRMNRRLLPKD